MSDLTRAAPHLWPIEDLVDQTARTMALYELGLRPGDRIGLTGLDKLYTVSPNQWTLITGFPGSGKSEFLDQILVSLAEQGWVFAVYSPENQPSEIHVAKLAEKIMRKPFAVGYNERMTRAELDETIGWIQDRFVWLAPTDPDLDTLLASAMPFLRGEKRAVILDPWNTIEHKRPKDLSETEYIGMALQRISDWVRFHHMHVFVVAHPMKMYRDKGTGKRPVPTPYDIAGSANWYNKGDSILCVDRDQIADTQDVQIYVQKIRYKHMGHIGMAHLRYDRITGRYHDAPGTYAEQTVSDF